MKVFCSRLKVRIGDINYGQHLGHDRLITLLHQARLDFLQHFSAGQADEISFFGVGLIMRRLEIDYLGEAFLNDDLDCKLWFSQVRRVGFCLNYEVWRGEALLARAMTEMVAFNYQKRRVEALPEAFFTLYHQRNLEET